MTQKLLTYQQAADVLAISRAKLYQLVNAGDFPVVRIGRSVRIPARAIDLWIAAHLDDPRV